MEKPTTTDRVLRAISGPLNIFTTLFVGLYIANLIIDAFFSFLYQTNEAKSLTDYSEVAAQYLLTGQIAKYVVASLVVSVVFFVLFSGLVSRLTKSMRRPKPSFITLSTGDEKRRDARLKQYSNRWTSLAATLGSDILVALLLLVAEDRFGYLIGLGH